ncbi:MAG: hypothetical protein LBS72_09850 [Oscillospiraceae bacterium]|jgi:hypothetical protein|nr:hypothetical protein [Oscillospiraceae bacterium]
MINHKVAKFLFLLPIVIMIGFSVVFLDLIKAGNGGLLQEKFLEKKLNVDMIVDQIDKFIERDGDWYSEYDFYKDSLAFSIEILDKVDMTFAAIYDETLQNISQRSPSYENSPFNPIGYPEFVSEVRKNELGVVRLWFEAENVKGRTMYTYYRWVPTEETLEGRFLAVVAISSYSVKNTLSGSITYWIVAMILITTVLNLALVAMLGSLGEVHESRPAGEKWRSRGGKKA